MTFSVALYKTKVSQKYAVVLGTGLDRSAALTLAAEARHRQLAADAFAQQDRSWDPAGTAPFPR